MTQNQYLEKFVVENRPTSLVKFLEVVDASLEQLQSEKNLRSAIASLFDDLLADNVIYVEIRFAPLLHTVEGLTGQQVLEVVADAVRLESLRTQVEARILLCVLRHYNEAQVTETLELLTWFSKAQFSNEDLLVGVDLASNESIDSIHLFKHYFEQAKNLGKGLTCHAGEARGAESVWQVLSELNPDRIGHGVRSIEDSKLIEFLRERKIHLEVCPTSNIQTGVFQRIEDHAVGELYQQGIHLGINTDGRGVSNVSLTDEYEKLVENFGWNLETLLSVNLNSLEASFIDQTSGDQTSKDRIRKRLLKGFELAT